MSSSVAAAIVFCRLSTCASVSLFVRPPTLVGPAALSSTGRATSTVAQRTSTQTPHSSRSDRALAPAVEVDAAAGADTDADVDASAPAASAGAPAVSSVADDGRVPSDDGGAALLREASCEMQSEPIPMRAAALATIRSLFLQRRVAVLEQVRGLGRRVR